MSVAHKFALRYVFSKKKTNAINIISGITALAFAVGAAAMIIVLSALNGFETTITGLFNTFDPELKIESKKGKTFKIKGIPYQQLLKANGVDDIAQVIEDNAVIKFGESQEIAILKGVSNNYNQITEIDSAIVEGSFQLKVESDHLMYEKDFNGAVFGYEIAKKLGVSINHSGAFATVYVPKKGELNSLNPEQNLNIEKVLPTGSFFVQEEIDSRYIIVSLDFAKQIFEKTDEVSSLEVSLKPGFKADDVKLVLLNLLGEGYTVKNKYEQQESVYKIFKSEKLATFSILSFILLIAAFNMAGALTMLIIEKEKDIQILRSMGANSKTIKLIFIYSGLIISLIGSLIGIVFGAIICSLQIKYGLLRIENSVVDAYPMAIQIWDFILVFIISIGIGLITAWIPVRKIEPMVNH